ncbi:MAG: sugar ABC transporter substrate-binding protein [Lachnospiraceae bacterium]|nr:sugar ABC transporter substrate-binding protein [Lachnospiraceae bacterium]
MGKRLFSAFLVLALGASMAFFAYRSGLTEENTVSSSEASPAAGEASFSVAKDNGQTLTVWYADDALSEFLSTEALAYQAQTGTHIDLKQVSGVDYLEQINTASVYDGETAQDGSVYEAPDLYLTTHDTLLRAYLAGLADPVRDPHQIMIAENFPETSLHAVSCDGKYVAYPLYYETNFFLYNKTYMRDIASAKVEADTDRAQGVAAQEAIDAEGGKPAEDNKDADGKSGDDKAEEDKKQDEGDEKKEEDESAAEDGEDAEEVPADEEEGDPMGEEDAQASPEVLKQLSTMIPSTMDDIRNFANNYDAPEAVEAVFKWDVSDIFYNYFFVGNYMNVGGEDGDNNAIFNIYNKQAVECLSVYYDLNSFFSIEDEENTYDSILQEFLDGKTVFTVATTDAVSKIEQAKLDGNFDFEYGISVLPDLSSTLKVRGLSVTTCMAVNGYSDNKDAANDFASYLSFEKGQELYRKAGKISCKRGCVYENNEIYNIMNEYEKSVSLPKMVETADFWVQLEIAFSKILNGADPDETLKALSDKVGGSIESIDYHIPVQETIGAGAGTLLLPE